VSDVLQYITSDGNLREKKYDRNDSTIDLSNLDIRHFDASQLATNDSLRTLKLAENKMARFDITPLIECKKLGTLILDGETNVETLLSYDTMEEKSRDVVFDAVDDFDAPSYLPSLNSIRISYDCTKKREPDWKLIHLFVNSLRVTGFGWMGMLDIGVRQSKDVLEKILESGNTPEIQNILLSYLIERIDSGQPTINLDVESMTDFGDLVLRIDDVVEQRTAEMKDQFVPVLAFGLDQESLEILESLGESVDSHYADLRMLLLTSYGYEVIESLGLGTTCEMKVFSKIQEALSSLGFNLRTNLDPNTYHVIGWRNRKVLRAQGIESLELEIKLPPQLSGEMIEYIWQLAEFRNTVKVAIF